jgi:hypothetical protein
MPRVTGGLGLVTRAVMVGGGHNGLVVAWYLARAGIRNGRNAAAAGIHDARKGRR